MCWLSIGCCVADIAITRVALGWESAVGCEWLEGSSWGGVGVRKELLGVGVVVARSRSRVSIMEWLLKGD